MPMQVGRLFQGVPPSGSRKATAKLIGREQERRGWETVYVPCAGAFAITEVFSRHFPTEQLYTSDITLFTSLVGYVLDPDKTPSDLAVAFDPGPAQSTDPDDDADAADFTGAEVLDWEDWTNDAYDETDEIPWVARCLLSLKHFSMDATNYFSRDIRSELADHRDRYAENVENDLRRHVDQLGGIHYDIRDVYEALPDREFEEDAVMFFNPPAYSTGYGAMFDTGGIMTWDEPDIPQFDPNQRQTVLDAYGRDSPLDIVYYLNNPDIWSQQFDTDTGGWDRFFVKKYSEKRRDYLCANWDTRDFREVERPADSMRGGDIPVWEPGDWCNKHSEVQFVELDADRAEYYRNLFLKQLKPGVSAELNGAFLVDGKMIGVVGINFGIAIKDGKDYVYEVYGITPVYSELAKPINRLLMRFLVTDDFRDDLTSIINFSTAEENLTGIHTTCISRHPEVRINNGLLDIIDREERDDGKYKIQYAAEFRDKSYQQQIVEYWDEVERYEEMLADREHADADEVDADA